MPTRNPVLSRPDAWQVPGGAQTQTFQQPGAYPPPGYGDPNAAQFAPAPVANDRMTIDDVLTKSAVTLGTLAAVAVLTFLFLPAAWLLPAVVVGALGSFVPVLLVSFRRNVNPAFVLAYAAIEGVFIGAVSALYEGMWNGIVPAALAGTVFAAAATLGAYKFFRIKVTSKFRKMVIIGTMAYAALLLVNFVLSFFGLAFITAGTMTIWALVFSAVGIGLAVFNLIMDFDYIEQGIAMGAPASESWRGAFGLTVTLVWLYVELLRLLSYFRN
jgi:uncharacterized YccA/Bax inhibitor family protein